LDANLFISGTEVQFTCETHVTGGLSAVDRKVSESLTTE
jgi:pterin-4a-carbinolamine dehydratase